MDDLPYYVVLCLRLLSSPCPDSSSSQMQPENALGVQSPPSNRWASLYPELIYKVFTYCLSGATLDVCSPELFPWHLGHACTSWRSVFVFSPRFWDRFTFEVLELGRVTIDHLERALTLVKLCVKRTQDQPFSFRFNARAWTRRATTQLQKDWMDWRSCL